mgnify:FL=1
MSARFSTELCRKGIRRKNFAPKTRNQVLEKVEYDWLGHHQVNRGPRLHLKAPTWGECVKRDDLWPGGLRAECAHDRILWKGLFGGNRPTRASMEKWTLNVNDD